MLSDLLQSQCPPPSRPLITGLDRLGIPSPRPPNFSYIPQIARQEPKRVRFSGTRCLLIQCDSFFPFSRVTVVTRQMRQRIGFSEYCGLSEVFFRNSLVAKFPQNIGPAEYS